MKKIILLMLLFAAFTASAQVDFGYTYIGQKYKWMGGLFTALGIPSGDNADFAGSWQHRRAGQIYYDSTGVDSGLYVWSGLAWRNIESGGGATYYPGEGMTMSNDSIHLGGLIGSPGIFYNQRAVNVNRNIMHWTNGIASESGGGFWQFSHRPWSPYQFISQDTVTSTGQVLSIDKPLTGLFARRVLYYNSGVYRTDEKTYGHYTGLTYSFQDTMTAYTAGGDYHSPLIAEYRIKPRNNGYSAFRTGHGTGTNLRRQEGIAAIVANMYVDAKDDAATDTLHVNGTLVGVTPYLVAATGAGKMFIDNVVYVQPGNIINSNVRITKSFLFSPAISYGTGLVDSAFGYFDTTRIVRSHHAGKYVFGSGNATATSDAIRLFGNLTMTDSLIVGTQTEVSDTTGMDVVLRRRSDGSYVRIRADLLGGGTGGIDDVLAIGQSLTATRDIDLDGNALRFMDGATGVAQFAPTFTDIISLSGTDLSGYASVSNGAGSNYTDMYSSWSGGSKFANVRSTSSSLSGKIILDADSLIANPITFVAEDTTNYKPVVIGPGNNLSKSWWYGPGGSGGANTALSNLASVAINTSLISDADNADDLGSSANAWKDVYVKRVLADGSTSGGVEFKSDALGNAPAITTLSGTGYGCNCFEVREASDFTGQNINTVQPMFNTAIDVWPLQASTAYDFEGFISLNHGAVSHSVGLSFELSGGASVTSISYMTMAWVTAIGTNTASQTTNFIQVATNVNVNAAGSNATEQIFFKGTINMNAAGNVTPSYTYSAAPGGTVLTKAGSLIKFCPKGTNTFTNIGPAN